MDDPIISAFRFYCMLFSEDAAAAGHGGKSAWEGYCF